MGRTGFSALWALVITCLILPGQVFAQCALWNSGVNQTTGEPFNTIEFPPGTVIGFANPTTNRAESFEGVPLSQQGVTCVTKDGQIYDPDNLRQVQGEEPDDDDNGGQIGDICAIAPGLSICQPPDDGGGGGGIPNPPFPPGGGGGGGGGGGNGGGGGGNSGAGPQPPPELGGDGASDVGAKAAKGADGALVSTAALDGINSANGKRRDPSKLTEFSLDLLSGTRRAPVLISPRDLKKSQLNFISHDSAVEGKGQGSAKRPNVGGILGFEKHEEIPEATRIGTDNEVLKSAMAVYQPDRRRRMDFLNDKNSRDLYLQSSKTLRGVTVMAMGFLDKTLGAGLHAVDQQAANQLQNDMLKQISWTMTRIGNDDRAQVMRDVDEKVEACLEHAFDTGVGAKEIGGDGVSTTRKRVWYECPAECGEPPLPGGKKYRTPSDSKLLKSGNGTYAYCVCCAESVVNINELSEGGRSASSLKNAKSKQLWTLSERVFYGVHPQNDPSLDKRIQTFNLLFGDVVLKPNDDAKADVSTPADGGNDPYFIYVTQFPKASPQKIVSMYKNRCYHTQGGKVESDLGKIGECHLQEETLFGIECGICPGLSAVLSRWSEFNGTTAAGRAAAQGGAGFAAGLAGNPQNPGAGLLQGIIAGAAAAASQAAGSADCKGSLTKIYTEATLGSSLTMREIKAFLALNGDRQANVKSGDEKQLLATVMETWCESSAIAAAARLYSVEKGLAMDHVVASNLLTEGEKAQLLRLVDRYGEYLNLAQVDANSRLAALALNTGMSILYDRHGAAYTASAQNTAFGAAEALSGSSQTFGSAGNGNVTSSAN